MPEKILLVEDDNIMRQELKDYLNEYHVVEAENAKNALVALKGPAKGVSIVILDVVLPDKSGTAIIKEIRRLAPHAGIIILTGYSTKSVVIEALRGHVDDYIEKPPGENELKESIEKLLDERKKNDPLPQDIHDKIRRVKDFARKNTNKKISLTDAALRVYMSPKYLSRVFREHTGVSFSRYRLKLKIQESKVLLKKKGLSVNQIAYMLGYRNTESFIRMFEKITGQTPTEYKKCITRGKEKRYAK